MNVINRQVRCFPLYVFLLLLLSCGQNENSTSAALPRPVKAMQLGQLQAFNGRFFPGRAKAAQEVNLSFNVSGSLIQLPVKIGDKVKKGKLIAKLDPRDFEAKLKLAKAELTRDEQNYRRAKELVGKGHISKSDYDLIESKWIMSQANVDLAEKALLDSVLTAPFDGQIANLYVENYQTVSNQQSIARLLDIAQIEMIIQVPEGAISFVPYAKNLVVQFDAFPDELIPAQIKEISNEASPDTRTYPVTLTMKQPKNIQILPGMAGKVRGQVEQQQDANKLSVPSSAVLTVGNDDKTYVWLIDPKTKKVHRQEIQIGELTAGGISVVSGLKSGDWIVTAGIHSIQEGDAVRILNQENN